MQLKAYSTTAAVAAPALLSIALGDGEPGARRARARTIAHGGPQPGRKPLTLK